MFEALDFVYMPSADVAADLAHFTGVLGGELRFAIEAYGTRVAMLRMGAQGPDILLAGHLEGESPVLVYRVDDLDATVARLRERGCDPGPTFGIPHGPCCSFRTSGGHRIAAYEPTRPQASAHLEGRRDF